MTEDLTKDSGGTRKRSQIYLEIEYVRKGFIRSAIYLILKIRMETGEWVKGDCRQRRCIKKHREHSMTEPRKM